MQEAGSARREAFSMKEQALRELITAVKVRYVPNGLGKGNR